MHHYSGLDVAVLYRSVVNVLSVPCITVIFNLEVLESDGECSSISSIDLSHIHGAGVFFNSFFSLVRFSFLFLWSI